MPHVNSSSSEIWHRLQRPVDLTSAGCRLEPCCSAVPETKQRQKGMKKKLCSSFETGNHLKPAVFDTEDIIQGCFAVVQ
jgi:hypothetical protein